MLDAVLSRFIGAWPVAVLAQLTLQRALSADWVDAVFAAHTEQQYTRELLFSTVVDLMALVAIGLRPSVHAAAREALADGTLAVSLRALYAKINHSEPAVLRALVQERATRLTPVVMQLRPAGAAETMASAGATAPPWLAGYRVRVLDGNHLPPSEKRVKPLRGSRTAARPGQALVVYAPEHDLVMDLVVGEDAHAQEPAYVPPLLTAAAPGELWIADRNLATRGILTALDAQGAAVLVCEHALHPHPTPTGEWRCVGRCPTGLVYEQPVDCPPPMPARPPEPSQLRRIEVELDTPLESGETVLRLLTTLPADAADAATVAALYRRRWTIEGLFQRLQAVLHSEVRTLGQPRAALLAFTVAVVAYNVLAVVQAAVETQATAVPQGADAVEPVPISLYYVAHTVREHYRGLLIAVSARVWADYDAQPPAALAASLRQIAAHVRLEAYRKHPRGSSGPRQKKGYVSRDQLQHVSTARLLAEQKERRRQQGP